VIQLIIPGNTPSKKNSKRIFCPRRCRGVGRGRPNLVLSKEHEGWHRAAAKTVISTQNIRNIKQKLHYPVTILLFFYRSTKYKFDYTNAIESIMDLLVDVDILVDDNAKRARPIPVGHAVDKEHPRALVYIFNHGEDWMEKFKKLEGEVV
jgi:hypothetical protein